jgi:orotate phosphoribosyltransferase
MASQDSTSKHELIYLGSVNAVKRAGSLQMTIPAEASHLVNLKDGDTIFVFYDLSKPGQLIILRPSEITLSGTNIRYSIADEEKVTLSILEQSGAYLPEGHYVLASGYHSSRYIQVRLATAVDQYVTILGQRIADKFCNDSIGVVAGFSIGGVPLAKAVVASLNEESQDAQVLIGRITREGQTQERRVQFDKAILRDIDKKSKVLVVDDVLTTGGTILSALETLKREGKGKPTGVAVVVDRSEGRNPFSNHEMRFVKMISINLEKYTEEECPLCKLGVPKKDLSNAENDRSSVLSLLPKEKQDTMLMKYEEVQRIQDSVKEWTQ